MRSTNCGRLDCSRVKAVLKLVSIEFSVERFFQLTLSTSLDEECSKHSHERDEQSNQRYASVKSKLRGSHWSYH
jgi:hypothetical protein